MAELPKSIKITDDEAAALEVCKTQQQAFDKFVETQQAMMRAQGEARAQELVAAQKKVWTALATKYGIDIEHVAYEFNSAQGTIVPRMVRMS